MFFFFQTETKEGRQTIKRSCKEIVDIQTSKNGSLFLSRRCVCSVMAITVSLVSVPI
uniref:Uncharacterized protein n=1 Tax=Lepeophtheirus salmonis TaxID=72036 RepID=A0A0K2VHI0_LEPSM